MPNSQLHSHGTTDLGPLSALARQLRGQHSVQHCRRVGPSDRLATGTLESLVHERHVTGMTSNPTIFQKAISGSDVYDEQLRDPARPRVHVGEALRTITTYDVLDGRVEVRATA